MLQPLQEAADIATNWMATVGLGVPLVVTRLALYVASTLLCTTVLTWFLSAVSLRSRATLAMVITVAVVASSLILAFSQSLDFVTEPNDEIRFLTERSITDPASWVSPHNGHWSTIHVVLYAGIASIFGAVHLPFQVVLLTLHAVATVLVYVLLQRLASRSLAFAGAVIHAFLGAGYENIVGAGAHWAARSRDARPMVGPLSAMALGSASNACGRPIVRSGRLQVLTGRP